MTKIKLLQYIRDILRQIQKTRMEIIIRKAAQKEGLSKQQENIAVAVARCESELNPKATNKIGNHPSTSTDRGLYQWNDYWHKEISDECAFNPECATKAFCRAVKDGHLNWWNASRECWKKYI